MVAGQHPGLGEEMKESPEASAAPSDRGSGVATCLLVCQETAERPVVDQLKVVNACPAEKVGKVSKVAAVGGNGVS